MSLKSFFKPQTSPEKPTDNVEMKDDPQPVVNDTPLVGPAEEPEAAQADEEMP